MNPYQMVVAIVFLALTASVVKTYLNRPYRGSNELLKNLNTRLESLEKRVANLETITTSKEYRLHQEFEDLEKAG